MNLRNAFLILIILVFLSLVHLALYVQSLSIQYEIDRLKSQIDILRSENRSLGSVLASAESLDKIEAIAVQKLKMVRPEKIHYILIGSNEAKTSGDIPKEKP